MIKTVFLFILSLTMISAYCQWEHLYTHPEIPMIQGIEHNQSGKVFMAGYSPDMKGYLLTTDDLGTTIDTVYILSGFLFTDLALTNDSTIYITGFGSNKSIICKSTDYGVSWDTTQFGDSLNFAEIEFPTETVGFAGGENGHIYKTIDSGNNWLQVFHDSTYSFQILEFKTESFGHNGAYLITTNGGYSWTYNNSIPSFSGRTTSFVNDSTGYYAYPSNDTVYFYRTTDYGQAWTLYSSINVGQSINPDFYLMYFYNDTIGYSGGNVVCRKTIDGGYTWVNQGALADLVYKYHFVSPDSGFALALYGAELYRTTVGGVTMINNDEAKENLTSIIYPNPTSDFVTINVEKFMKAEFINNNGELLIRSFTKEIDLKGIPSGLYFVRIYTERGMIVKKIIKT